MTLSEKQQKFTMLVAKLIMWAYQNDYRLTFGEAYRTPEQAALNAKSGKGIAKSLHTQRLAIDLNLFIGQTYAMSTEQYKPLGDYWKTLDVDARWGGDFTTRPDGNHFSLEDGGIR